MHPKIREIFSKKIDHPRSLIPDRCPLSSVDSSPDSDSEDGEEASSTVSSPNRKMKKRKIDLRCVTLRLKPQFIKEHTLVLPKKFMKAIGLVQSDKIRVFGTKAEGCLGTVISAKDGLVGMLVGWKHFCESNGVKIGDYFTLEVTDEKDKWDKETKMMLRFTAQVYL